jgi:hypothetical protein
MDLRNIKTNNQKVNDMMNQVEWGKSDLSKICSSLSQELFFRMDKLDKLEIDILQSENVDPVYNLTVIKNIEKEIGWIENELRKSKERLNAHKEKSIFIKGMKAIVGNWE